VRLAALGAVGVLLTSSPAAGAGVDGSTEPPASARAVLSVQMGGTSMFDRSSATPGGAAGAAVTVGAGIAGEYRIADRLWLAGTFGLSHWIGGPGVDAGYLYRRLDLGVAPRFLIRRWSGWAVATTIEVSAPIGLTKPFVTVPQRRAFTEQVESAWGWYAGGVVDVTVLFNFSQTPHGPSPGVRAGMGYTRHASHRRTTFAPTDTTQPVTVEETDLVDHDLLFILAGVVAF
jgi:hypothetical protein